MKEIDIAIIKKYLEYDEASGLLIWKQRDLETFKYKIMGENWNERYAGQIAGSIDSRGYVVLKINDKTYRAHRIIWAMVYGEWPDIIDHIDGNPTNNRLSNLRNVTSKDNARNRKVMNKLGERNIFKVRNLYMVYIRSAGFKQRGIKTLEEAVIIRDEKEKEFGYVKRS